MKPQNDEKPESNEDANPASIEEGGTAPSGGGSADIQAIVDDLTENMPDVQEHAIAQDVAQQEEQKAQYADLRDRDGNGFDPSVHKVNKEGEPTLSPKGLLIKKPGRKPGQRTAAPRANSVVGGKAANNNVPDVSMQKEQNARIAGSGMANLFIATSVMVMGDEWTPRQGEIKMGETVVPIDEKAQLETVFGDWCVATDQEDLPPGLALAAGLLMYAAPRFTQPKTKARASSWWQSVKKWAANRKLKKHGLKAEKRDKVETK